MKIIWLISIIIYLKQIGESLGHLLTNNVRAQQYEWFINNIKQTDLDAGAQNGVRQKY